MKIIEFNKINKISKISKIFIINNKLKDVNY